MSLLSLVKTAARRLGVSPNLTAVFGSNDPSVLLMLELAQEEGRDLANRHPWSALQAEATFTTVATAAQPSSIPADFHRFIDETMFNRTLRRRIDGPISPQEWQDLQSGLISRVGLAFRVRGPLILLSPTPASGQTVVYEYVSTSWCQSAAGAPQSAWTADTDTGLLPETLMSLGVEWRFRARKGFDHEVALRTYERQVSDAIFRDGGRRTISTSPASGEFDRFDREPGRTWGGTISVVTEVALPDLANLPTSPPAGPPWGQPWNNNGGLAWT